MLRLWTYAQDTDVVGEEQYVYTLVNEVKEVIIRVCLPKLVIPQADLKIIIIVIAWS